MRLAGGSERLIHTEGDAATATLLVYQGIKSSVHQAARLQVSKFSSEPEISAELFGRTMDCRPADSLNGYFASPFVIRALAAPAWRR